MTLTSGEEIEVKTVGADRYLEAMVPRRLDEQPIDTQACHLDFHLSQIDPS